MSTAPPLKIVTPRRKLIVMGAVCALFTAMGAVVLWANPTAMLNLIVGVTAIAFFGLGGGWSIGSQLVRSTLVVADDEGLRIRGEGVVPWTRVDRIGADAERLGIRLRGAVAGAGSDAEARRASRAATGWDISWPAGELDRPPRAAAAAIEARRPR